MNDLLIDRDQNIKSVKKPGGDEQGRGGEEQLAVCSVLCCCVCAVCWLTAPSGCLKPARALVPLGTKIPQKCSIFLFSHLPFGSGLVSLIGSGFWCLNLFKKKINLIDGCCALL